jgi:hypothetical protein
LAAASAIALSIALAADPANARTWRSANGKFSLEAELIDVTATGVVLQKADGTEVRLPFVQLSQADREYVHEWRTSKTPGRTPNGNAPNAAPDNAPNANRSPATARKWSDKTGSFTVDAELTGVTDTVVVLKRADGNMVRVALELLSDADREYVREWRAPARAADAPSTASANPANGNPPPAAHATGSSFKALAEGVRKEIDAKQNATEQLRVALADLPKLMTAKVVGPPGYDKSRSEIVLTVEIAPDVAGYEQFRTRLEEVLEKIAIATTSFEFEADGETELRIEVESEGRSDAPIAFGADRAYAPPVSTPVSAPGMRPAESAFGGDTPFAGAWALPKTWPKLRLLRDPAPNVQTPVFLLVNSSVRKKATGSDGTHTQWKNYLVEADPRSCILGTSHVCLHLVDREGRAVVQDRFTLCRPRGLVAVREAYGAVLVYLGPVLMDCERYSAEGVYCPSLQIKRRISATLEQLEKIVTVRGSVVYEPPMPATSPKASENSGGVSATGSSAVPVPVPRTGELAGLAKKTAEAKSRMYQQAEIMRDDKGTLDAIVAYVERGGLPWTAADQLIGNLSAETRAAYAVWRAAKIAEDTATVKAPVKAPAEAPAQAAPRAEKPP